MCAIAANSNYYYLCLHGTYEATAISKLNINTAKTPSSDSVSSKAHSLPCHQSRF